jgi:hypothetical protein
MKKRDFLSTAMTLLLGVSATSTSASASTLVRTASGNKPDAQTILTVTGAIEKTNRGKIDPMMDQLMHKQGILFDYAFQFALADLEKLPVATINPTLEYDARAHKLSGPRLMDVLNAVGIKKGHPTKIVFHGVDGYSPEITVALAQKYNFILATHIDDQLLPIGGFGPLFAIYDADRIPEMAQKPLDQRFAHCPWGLYCIQIVK